MQAHLKKKKEDRNYWFYFTGHCQNAEINNYTFVALKKMKFLYKPHNSAALSTANPHALNTATSLIVA